MTRRPVVLTRPELRALTVTRVVPHRPATLGPKALLHHASKKRSRRSQPEHEIQVAYFRWVDTELELLHPGASESIYAIPNGGKRGKLTAWKMKMEGQRAGVLDIAIDCARGGFFGMKLEIKTEDGRLSEAQKARIMRLDVEGYCASVARSLEQAQVLTLAYLSKPRTKVAR